MKRRSLAPLIALAVVALVSLAAPAAQAADTPRCGQQSAKTYFKKGTMRMYLRTVKLTNFQTGGTFTGPRMYACSSKFRKGVPLALCEFSYECFSNRYTWDGRYLFYKVDHVGPTNTYGSDLYLADLKAGTSNSDVRLKGPGLDVSSQCTPDRLCLRWLIKFATGWGPDYVTGSQVTGFPYSPPLDGTHYVLESHCWSHNLSSEVVTVLDRPKTLEDLKSLRITTNSSTKASTAHWTSDRKAQTAAICV